MPQDASRRAPEQLGDVPPRLVGWDWSGWPTMPYTWLATAAPALAAPAASAAGGAAAAAAGADAGASRCPARVERGQLARAIEGGARPGQGLLERLRNDSPPVGGAIRLHTRLFTSEKRMKVLK